jgi:hypothetical protein
MYILSARLNSNKISVNRQKDLDEFLRGGMSRIHLLVFAGTSGTLFLVPQIALPTLYMGVRVVFLYSFVLEEAMRWAIHPSKVSYQKSKVILLPK